MKYRISFIFLICIALVSFFCTEKKDLKIAKQGFIDLSEIDLSDFYKYKLEGQWEFYWNNLGDFEAIDGTPKEQIKYAEVPKSWNSYRPEGGGGEGFATYRLTVRFPAYGIRYYLRIPPQTSAYRLYVNRKLLTHAGVVSANKEGEQPEYKLLFSSFEPTSYDTELILVVSNFHHARGGFRRSLELGSKGAIQGENIRLSAGEIFVFGALVSMGLYQLTVFLLRREEYGSLFFAIFCFLTSIRLVVLDNFYIMYVFPNFSWELMQKIDYMSSPFLVTAFISYFKSLYPSKSDVPNWLFVSSWVFSFVFGLFVLFTSASVFSKANFLSLAMILVFCFAILFFVIKVYKDKRKDSELIFYGFLLLMIGGMNDLFAGNFMPNAPPLLGFFLFFFCLVQSILLSRRNARIYSSMEQLTEELIEINKRLEESNLAYSKFVPLKFLESFDKPKSINVVRGDYVVRNMTVLSSDIRDFTSISEGLSPSDNFLFLNDYLSRVGPVIRSNQGFIEKYIGDAILAFFDKGPDSAILTAIDMHKVIALWNNSNRAENYPEIQIGVGIHYGELMLGVIGEEQRIESAVLSDTAGIANTLESMTKKYGAKVIISLDALLETKEPDSHPHRILDFIKVPAKNKLVGIAEILLEGLEDNAHLKILSKVPFERGVNAFWDGNFTEALDEFNYVLNINPTDKASKLYREKSILYIQNGAPPGWEKG